MSESFRSGPSPPPLQEIPGVERGLYVNFCYEEAGSELGSGCRADPVLVPTWALFASSGGAWSDPS